jgi:hypothetical protein
MPTTEYTVIWDNQLRLIYDLNSLERLKDRLKKAGYTYRIIERKLKDK